MFKELKAIMLIMSEQMQMFSREMETIKQPNRNSKAEKNNNK